MTTKRADIAWYTGISQEKGVQPRCPFATVHRCPRYYQSLSLLGLYGGSTAIDPHDDEVLLKKWEKSDLWPVVREQATSIISRDEEPRMFNNFCPETAYDRFGLFATDLYHYTDEIDIDVAHTRLGRERAGGEDWQWTWESIHPMHYTECPLYSLLLAAPGTEHRSSESGSSSPVKILDLRPSFHGLSINLNALVDRVRRWWTSRK
jgi:hypothetical protein